MNRILLSHSVPRIGVLPTLLRGSLASPHGRRECPPQRGGQKPPPSRRLGRGCSHDTLERGKPWSRGLVACLPHVQRKLCALPMPASKQPPPGYPVRTHSSACLAHHYMYIACERTRMYELTPSESTERTPCLAASSHLCHFLCVRSMSAIASIFMPDQELDIPGQFGHDRHARALASPPFALPAARAEKSKLCLHASGLA